MDLRNCVKDFLLKNLERYSLGYRILLRIKGASFCPERVSADYMNTTLKSRSELIEAIKIIKKAGLHLHPDDAKNWDALAALSFILQNTDRSACILDVGGEVYSPLIEWLYLYRYKSLYVINLSFKQDFVRGHIRYVRGDCTQTFYLSNSFDVITCLSVIEHSVHFENFLKECYRILRSGGFLIVSTDYWEDPIVTTGKIAYGAEVKIFTSQEMKQMIDIAYKIGFMPISEIDYSTKEKVVYWKRLGLNFTFIVFALMKV